MLLRFFTAHNWDHYKSQLLMLVVLASADRYIKPLWSNIQSGLGEVIESTVLPFFVTNKRLQGMSFNTMYETPF